MIRNRYSTVSPKKTIPFFLHSSVLTFFLKAIGIVSIYLLYKRKRIVLRDCHFLVSCLYISVHYKEVLAKYSKNHITNRIFLLVETRKKNKSHRVQTIIECDIFYELTVGERQSYSFFFCFIGIIWYLCTFLIRFFFSTYGFEEYQNKILF